MRTGRKIIILFFVFAASVFLSCTGAPDAPTAEQPATVIDRQQLESAFLSAASMPNLKCLIVAANDSVIREMYSGAAAPDNQHDVRSVTKTVMALLIGIAVEKGFIRSVDQSIADYLVPAGYTVSAEKMKIRIIDLLTMSSGLPWQELNVSSGEYNNWIQSPDQTQYMLDKTLSSGPGTVFHYNTGACHLLSVILTQASGMSSLRFAAQFLFEPLGIGQRSWQTDKQGRNNGGAGMNLTPRDMVTIGKIFLGKGTVNGKKIVSSSWIEESMRSHFSTDPDPLPYASGYGCCLWTGQRLGRGFCMAVGYGGQFILVLPSVNGIIIATSEWSGLSSTAANQQWIAAADLIMTKILPAFR